MDTINKIFDGVVALGKSGVSTTQLLNHSMSSEKEWKDGCIKFYAISSMCIKKHGETTKEYNECVVKYIEEMKK